MELKIISPSEDGYIKKIEWNHEELKREVSEKVEKYKDLVYSDEQIKEAKTDRANLRKFVDALESKRKELKKLCLAPYEDFEKKLKEITTIVNEPIQMIDKQVKSFEALQKEEKRTNLECFFGGYNPFEWLKFEQILDDKWLNASCKTEKAVEEIQSKVEQIKKDLETLQNLPDFSFEAVEVYKQSLDLNNAISEGVRLSEMQKKKAEAQKAEAVKPEGKEYVLTKTKTWVAFEAELSADDAAALREFFKSRGITYKSIQGKEV